MFDRWHVVFLVAGTGEKVDGGHRIIYEHANRLARKGHTVELRHSVRFSGDNLRTLPRQLLDFVRWNLSDRNPAWFDFDDSVRRRYRLFGKVPKVPAGAKVIATYWKTHELLSPQFLQDHSCYYLIQGVESWQVEEPKLHQHWRSPSVNIVVSNWLRETVRRVSGRAELVPNAIDLKFFNDADRQPSGASDRPPTILFGSMATPAKGSETTVKALNLIARSGTKFTAVSFGNVDPAVFGAEFAYEHHTFPAQALLRDLYNRADLYLNASLSEGWGLTLGEAAACGATLVVSDAEGHFEFARPGKSAFFFRRGDHVGLARKTSFLLARPSLRQRLAATAKHDIAPFNWDRASDEMERVLAQAGHAS